MVEVIVFAEGQTEVKFISEVVAPALRMMQVFIKAETLPTSLKGSGGAVNFERVKLHARNTLRSKKNVYLTTFLDLYALNTSFPCFEESKKQADIYTRTTYLENALRQTIVEHVACHPERFIPHIQPHEFESLLFSDVATLCNTPAIHPHWTGLDIKLKQVFNEKGIESPEHINGGYQTTPARRLEANLPQYRKTKHGPIGTKYITLPVIERECLHFHQWMEKLRALAQLQA